MNATVVVAVCATVIAVPSLAVSVSEAPGGAAAQSYFRAAVSGTAAQRLLDS